MPKPTESYIRNTIVRFLLIEVGNGERFSKKEHWEKILNYFDHKCCYCHTEEHDLEADHIIGMNISEFGFDCLGNVVPACGACNKKKNNLSRNNNQKSKYGWEIHLESLCNNQNDYKRREQKIRDYMKKYKYVPLNNKGCEVLRKQIESLKLDALFHRIKNIATRNEKKR